MLSKKTINFILICILIGALLFIFQINYLYYFFPTALLIFGLLFSRFAHLILFIWEKIGHVLGFINSKIILSVIYFFIITPYSLIYKRKGKSQYQNQLGKHEITMFKERKHTFGKSDFEKSW